MKTEDFEAVVSAQIALTIALLHEIELISPGAYGRVASAMTEKVEAEEHGLLKSALEAFAGALRRGGGGPRLKVVPGGIDAA